jgi:hypothetical protein
MSDSPKTGSAPGSAPGSRGRLPTGSLPALAMAGLVLAGCSNMNMGSFSLPGAEAPPPAAPSGPPPQPSIAPGDIVGRWGIAAYHKPEDRARTEAAARGQCSQPYVINRSSTGVAMLGHDNPAVQDMTIKASMDGRTFIGPGPEPGGADDREVVSFDGRVLILKWVDPEVASRYGTMVLVRCGAPGSPSAKRRS